MKTLTPCIPIVEAREVSDSLKKKKKCTHSVGDANPCGGGPVWSQCTGPWRQTVGCYLLCLLYSADWESCHLWSQCTGPWWQTVGCYLLCLLHSADWESCHLWSQCTGPWRQTVGCYLLCLLHSGDWESCHLWSQCTGPWQQTVGCYLLCLLYSGDWESCHLWTNRKYHEDNLWLLFLPTHILYTFASHAGWHK